MTVFLLNCFLILAAPLFFKGFVRFIQTRGKDHPLKTFREFLTLLGEGVKPGNDTSFIYETASSLILASIIMAGTLAPMVGHRAILNFENSGILFFSFLLLDKIIRTFGSRNAVMELKKRKENVFAGMLPEMTLYLLIIGASWICKSLSFDKLFSASLTGTLPEIISRIVFPAVLFILLLMEEDGGIGGYRGSDKAVVIFSGGLKEFLFAVLIAGSVLPYTRAGAPGMNVFLYFLLLLFITVLIAALTGVVRSRLRKFKVKIFPDAVLMAAVSAVVVLSVMTLLV